MNVQVTINERALSVPKGLTILQAARQNGIEIPTLCDHPSLPPHGSCRMCIVEIQGQANIPTACTTPISEGMVIHTDTPKIQSLRSDILRMLLSEHPSGCLFCPEQSHCSDCMVTLRKAGVTTGCRSCSKDEQCEFQAIVRSLDLSGVEYPTRYRMIKVRKDDPFIDRDFNLCVLCGRCVRVCEDLHFNKTLEFTQSGSETVIGTAFNCTLAAAGCNFCGSCVAVCPTGALSEKTRKWEGKAEQSTSSTCALCSIGCQIRLETRNGRVIGSLPDNQAGTNALCVKGRFGITEMVNHPSRLKEPAKKQGEHNLAIPWDEAAALAATRLSACPPQRFQMVISADSSIEDLYVADKFTRQVMRSASGLRIPAQKRLGDGLKAAVRLLQKSQPLNILEEARTILCLGLDGKYAQSVVEVLLHKAHNRGAKLITVQPADPRPHSLGNYADTWLCTLPGGDMEVVQALRHKVALKHNNGNETQPIGEAAHLLREADSPVFVIGPNFLTGPDGRSLLEAVEQLAEACRARLVVLPDDGGNLVGALWLAEGAPEQALEAQNPDVLYLIGEDLPVSLPSSEGGSPFVIYQNPFSSLAAGPVKADLILPGAVFTEENGALIDYSGQVRQMRQSVEPPGAALPAWEILSRIARAMGAQGFDYETPADIQAEIASLRTNFQVGKRVIWPAQKGSFSSQAKAPAADLENQPANEPTYMGFPLTRWVAGLHVLLRPPAQDLRSETRIVNSVKKEGLHV